MSSARDAHISSWQLFTGATHRFGSGSRVHRTTTRIERLLLMLTIGVTPLLDAVPPIGGFSAAWIWFAAMGAYVLFGRGWAFERTLQQPVFLAAFVFIATAAVMELFHPTPDFRDLIRFVQTVGGAVIIAALCRDRQAIRAGLYGFLLLGLLLTTVLLLTSYVDLRAANVKGFDEASQLRSAVYRGEGSDDLLKDLNRISFLCGLGATVALGFAAKATRNRWTWFVIAIVMLLGTLLPLSRSGIVIVGVSSLAILFSRRRRRFESVMILFVIGGFLYAVAPGAVFERFKTFDSQPEKADLRRTIFEGVLQGLPEFYLTGVGTSDYWNGWAVKQGIATRAHKPLGAHNSLFQVWIYWGLPGLLTFLVLLWMLYRCLPFGCGKEVLALCLLGLTFAMLIRLLFSHAFYEKDFTAMTGLLAGCRLWMWPRGSVLTYRRPVLQSQRELVGPIAEGRQAILP